MAQKVEREQARESSLSEEKWQIIMLIRAWLVEFGGKTKKSTYFYYYSLVLYSHKLKEVLITILGE